MSYISRINFVFLMCLLELREPFNQNKTKKKWKEKTNEKILQIHVK